MLITIVLATLHIVHTYTLYTYTVARFATKQKDCPVHVQQADVFIPSKNLMLDKLSSFY